MVTPENRSYTVRASQTVYYEVTCRAASEDEARVIVQSWIDGDTDDMLDLYEVDNNEYQIESVHPS